MVDSGKYLWNYLRVLNQNLCLINVKEKRIITLLPIFIQMLQYDSL